MSSMAVLEAPMTLRVLATEDLTLLLATPTLL